MLCFSSGDSVQAASDEDFSFTHENVLDSSMSTTSSCSLFLQVWIEDNTTFYAIFSVNGIFLTF